MKRRTPSPKRSSALRVTAMLLSLLMLLSVVAVMPVSAAVEYDYVIVETKTEANQITWSEFTTNFATYAAKNIQLACNVDASGLTAPLGAASADDKQEIAAGTAFSGTFDGTGYAVSGLTMPLFNSLNGATVKNLTLNGAMTTDKTSVTTLDTDTANGTLYTGALARVVVGGTVTVDRCVNNVSLTIARGRNAYIGGFIGFAYGESVDVRFNACVNAGNISDQTANLICMGGFVGAFNTGSATFTKCLNLGNVQIINPSKSVNTNNIANGGFVGKVIDGTEFAFEDCVNKGNVIGWTYAAGFVGDLIAPASFTNCYNRGNCDAKGMQTTAKAAMAAGIVGYVRKQTNFVSCVNYGALTSYVGTEGNKAHSRVGGIAGGLENVAVTVDSCENYGSISTDNSVEASATCGGLVGGASSSTILTIQNSFVAVLPTTTGGVVTYISPLVGQIKTANKTTITNTKYVSATAGDDVVADAAAWKNTLPIKGIGYQTTEVSEGTYNVRFVSTIAGSLLSSYDTVGYEVIRYTATSSGATTKETNTVYERLNGVDYTGGTDGMDTETPYFAPLVVTGVPADETVTFVVRPYVKNGDTVTYGNPFTVELAPRAAA